MEQLGTRDTKAPPLTQTIVIPVEIDGSVIDRKVVKIIDGMAQNAIEDITSSNAG